MILKEKKWWWKLTIFAANNYTAIGRHLYHPKGDIPSSRVIRHEKIHAKQQEDVGLLLFVFLYLFCFPFFYNPWRWRWEYEAYKEGSGWPDRSIRRELRSWRYGWLV